MEINAQYSTPTGTPYYQYIDRVWDSTVPLRQDKISPDVTFATIKVKAGRIAFTVDGSIPGKFHGHRLNEGDTLCLDSNSELLLFKSIQASDAMRGVIEVSLYPED